MTGNTRLRIVSCDKCGGLDLNGHSTNIDLPAIEMEFTCRACHNVWREVLFEHETFSEPDDDDPDDLLEDEEIG